MPIKKAAYKALRKSRVRYFRNKTIKTELKTLAKSFEKLASSKKIDEAKKALSYLVSKIDRAASKGIIKKNTASRKISRLMTKLASLSKT